MMKFKLLCLSILLLLSSCIYASFNKSLWPIWEVNNPLAKQIINHQKWQIFLDHCLKTNEEGINLIDYPNISKGDLELLRVYIEEMSQIKINEYNRAEQLAYWINLYNALTVRTVATYYPIASIDEINISPGLFSVGPWGAKLVKVNQLELSLDEIQNRIIRPIWNDPRIHYALNNGAIGAPNLSKIAFTGANVDNQLNVAAYNYINSLRGVQVIDGELVLSKIYDWFREDFGETTDNILFHLRQYANQPLKKQLDKINAIDNYMYNWHLNSTVILS